MNKIKQLEEELEQEKSKQKFACFYSPGTLFSESDSIEIENELNIKELIKKAKRITQRHGAKPYAFQIEDGNGKSLSGKYHLTGKLIKYDDISDNDNELRILKSNMECNNYPIVIENNNSYRHTTWFNEEDVILDWDGNVIRKGNDVDLMEYRLQFKKYLKDYYKKIKI